MNKLKGSRPRKLLGLATAAAAGFIAVGVVYLFGPRNQPLISPLPPAGSRSGIQSAPEIQWLEAPALIVEGLVRFVPQHVALPNLNSQAGSFLSAIDGRWINGTISVVIEAKRLRARIGGTDGDPTSELIVRDISGSMLVADIGGSRFILLQRSNGLAISGSSLRSPIELQRE